jgi:hypothetical protein
MFSLPPKPVAYLENEEMDQADAALIVYAVNRLPDYEAAVEALEHVLETVGQTGGYHLIVPKAIVDARAILARLRESVPAS